MTDSTGTVAGAKAKPGLRECMTAGARVDFAGTGLFAAGSGAFSGQRHVEDLLTLTGQLRPDHTGS